MPEKRRCVVPAVFTPRADDAAAGNAHVEQASSLLLAGGSIPSRNGTEAVPYSRIAHGPSGGVWAA